MSTIYDGLRFVVEIAEADSSEIWEGEIHTDVGKAQEGWCALERLGVVRDALPTGENGLAKREERVVDTKRRKLWVWISPVGGMHERERLEDGKLSHKTFQGTNVLDAQGSNTLGRSPSFQEIAGIGAASSSGPQKRPNR